MNRNNEIGSEFSIVKREQCNGLKSPILYNENLVFSGRTAIETIIRNVSIKSIAFPSYCCESMLVPFRVAGIEVCFYDVYYDNGLKIDLSVSDDVDSLLWCNYFGFSQEMLDLKEYKKCGGIIIEDITHSIMSKEQYHEQSDYLVASLRKWEPLICGGYCASVNGDLKYRPNKIPPKEYISLKKSAMELKSIYLENGDESLKPRFLSLFKKANEWLAENYSGLSIDDESKEYLSKVNADEHYSIRRKNAVVLYEGLSQIEGIVPLFRFEDMDCPLFVPVIIETGKRDQIRNKLTENKIYCPVHWPKPNAECKSNLYDVELSLICDQRYNSSDMERIISVLKSI
jgi:hypothetical protein